MARKLVLFRNSIEYTSRANKKHLAALGEAPHVSQGTTYVAAYTKDEAMQMYQSVGLHDRPGDIRKASGKFSQGVTDAIQASELFVHGAIFVTPSTRPGVLLVEGETLTQVQTGHYPDMVIARPKA